MFAKKEIFTGEYPIYTGFLSFLTQHSNNSAHSLFRLTVKGLIDKQNIATSSSSSSSGKFYDGEK